MFLIWGYGFRRCDFPNAGRAAEHLVGLDGLALGQLYGHPDVGSVWQAVAALHGHGLGETAWCRPGSHVPARGQTVPGRLGRFFPRDIAPDICRLGGRFRLGRGIVGGVASEQIAQP